MKHDAPPPPNELTQGIDAMRAASEYHGRRMDKRLRRLTGEPPPSDEEEPITGVFVVPDPFPPAAKSH